LAIFFSRLLVMLPTDCFVMHSDTSTSVLVDAHVAVGFRSPDFVIEFRFVGQPVSLMLRATFESPLGSGASLEQLRAEAAALRRDVTDAFEHAKRLVTQVSHKRCMAMAARYLAAEPPAHCCRDACREAHLMRLASYIIAGLRLDTMSLQTA